MNAHIDTWFKVTLFTKINIQRYLPPLKAGKKDKTRGKSKLDSIYEHKFTDIHKPKKDW
ncbi:hypothetical protein VCO01S_34930 [Vibrio comitans NBRC 102076]|uniref:Uncharacterized protein n=1 Tax=Vibrio comitans NBRC 102076 TaxID=1219078 RepID=A0A4Y3IU92_9VIBR|nr:hypothetical protein VCO01S_34930 [Vibrio comitans NBRC 102076]